MSLGSRCSFPRISPQLKSNSPTLSCFWMVRPTFSSRSSSQNSWASASAALRRCLGEQIMSWSMRSSRRGSALGKTCRQSLRLTLGNLQSLRSQSGFMSATCVLVGVPRTLMTSMRWSMLLSPTKSGAPLTISSRTQPSDQMSIMVEQWFAPKISSGARQQREQMQGRLGSLVRIFAEPKSHTTNRPSWTSRLCGLMSRWQMLSEWMQSSPRKAWQEQSLISKVESVLRWVRMQPQRSLSQYSMMMLRNWLPAYSVVKVPRTRMVNSPSSMDTISTSRFLYLGSWKTRLTATICPVFLILDLQTFPKVPWPTSERCSRSFSLRFLGVQSNVPHSFSRTSSSALLHSASFLPLRSFSSFFARSSRRLLRFSFSFSGFYFYRSFSPTSRFWATFLMMGPVSVMFLLMILPLTVTFCALFFFLGLVLVLGAGRCALLCDS